MRIKNVNAKAIAISLLLCLSSLFCEQTVGLLLKSDQAYEGYTFFAPSTSKTTYLIDMNGQMVHSWESSYNPGQVAYLLEDGHLLRTFNYGKDTHINAGGAGGGVEIVDWDGTVLWSYICSDSTQRSHHDVEMLPNGNILMIAWELKTNDECITAGRSSSLLKDGELWPDKIIEIKPIGSDSAEIVWEWHIWDHLIQDADPTKENYGDVADHPQLLDINCVMNTQMSGADWNHTNGIDYNAELDQIIISLHNMNEFYIIDHSTTTEEAAGHSGGKSGMGGDILYRWGNPYNYDGGTKAEQLLFLQHDAQWIPEGYPGAGNILIFNNGNQQKRPYSTVDEVSTPLQDNGTYDINEAPTETEWNYQSQIETEFYAVNISGAQRLPNGNTLICEGPSGRFFEVTPGGETVWKYLNPVAKSGIVAQGDSIPTSSNGAYTNPVFRCYRYAPDYTGLIGKDLSPKGTIEIGGTATIIEQKQTTEIALTQRGNKLQITGDVSTIRLYTLQGKVVSEWSTPSGILEIGDLSSALYLVKIDTKSGVKTVPLLIEK